MWQEYTEELYKKDLHNPDNHDGVITHLKPDILECEVKWALESITTNKACGGDGIPVELFQILKDDAVKVLHSIGQKIWKTEHWPQDWKRSVFIPIPKKGNAKECSNYHTIALISRASKDFPGGSDGKVSAYNAGDLGSIPGSGRSPGEGNGNPLQYSCLENPMDGGAWWATVHGVTKNRIWRETSLSYASKVMVKILQARLQQYVNRELPDIQARSRKGRGTRDQIANTHWIMEKPISSRKTSTSALLTIPKPLTVWIPTNWKILRDRNTRPADLPPEKSVCRSRSSS